MQTVNKMFKFARIRVLPKLDNSFPPKVWQQLTAVASRGRATSSQQLVATTTGGCIEQGPATTTPTIDWPRMGPATDPAFDKLDLSFSNAQEAYRAKRNSELLRGYLVFQLCSFRFVVDNNKQVMAAV